MSQRVLVVVAGPPARGVVRMVLPRDVWVALPGDDLSGARFDRILVQREARRHVAGALAVWWDALPWTLAIGGEMHTLETLPEVVADVLAGEEVVRA